MLLIQYLDRDNARRVGVLEEDGSVRRVFGYVSTYDLAQAAIAQKTGLADLAGPAAGAVAEQYADLARERRLLPPLDHPDPAHCYVTGTGLTHLGSAASRDSMHKKMSEAKEEDLTDSMKMFRLGLEGGKPSAGQVGAQPEWFYKGDGSTVVAPEAPLVMPAFSQDGGEEPELAVLYVVGPDGTPYRLGCAIGNEFSDHETERFNYLWLAHSKLRPCSFGPALLVGGPPEHVEGVSRIRAVDGSVRWEKAFVSGEANMSHTLANLEHHHFKYGLFRRPGDVHVHFLGTATLSVSEGIKVLPGETFEIEAKGFGPALRNALAVALAEDVRVEKL